MKFIEILMNDSPEVNTAVGGGSYGALDGLQALEAAQMADTSVMQIAVFALTVIKFIAPLTKGLFKKKEKK